MNSRQLWGAQVRNKILNYVRENGETTRKEIIDHCGEESASQIKSLLDRGGLVRIRKGVYAWQEQKVKVF